MRFSPAYFSPRTAQGARRLPSFPSHLEPPLFVRARQDTTTVKRARRAAHLPAECRARQCSLPDADASPAHAVLCCACSCSCTHAPTSYACKEQILAREPTGPSCRLNARQAGVAVPAHVLVLHPLPPGELQLRATSAKLRMHLWIICGGGRGHYTSQQASRAEVEACRRASNQLEASGAQHPHQLLESLQVLLSAHEGRADMNLQEWARGDTPAHSQRPLERDTLKAQSTGGTRCARRVRVYELGA